MDWFAAKDGHSEIHGKNVCGEDLLAFEKENECEDDGKEDSTSSEVSFLLKDPVALSAQPDVT